MDEPSSSGQWRFAQCFGDKGEVEDITEGVWEDDSLGIVLTFVPADIISTVEFDSTGNYLATGDKGGRVVLFERNQAVSPCPHPSVRVASRNIQKKGCEYKFYTEFQSHDPEFDYLKSLEIEEKINKIKWCKRQNQAHFLLSTNGVPTPLHAARRGPQWMLILFLDKTIKLWKVFEKGLKVVSESNQFEGSRALPPPVSIQQLRLPRMTLQDNIIAAIPRKIYSNAHAYHIHSISVNSDQETFISADDLRINLWNLNISNQSFSLSFLTVLFIILTAPRRCGYQTCQYGGTHGGHHRNRIPSNTVQSVHVLQFQVKHQAGRHAGLCPL